MIDIPVNKHQTPITEELLNSLPEEVQEELISLLNTVPYIRNLISPNRRYARDLPRDEEGKIIVDLTNPHILEDMDYFRPTAIHFEKYGTLTDLTPNANRNSEYGRWLREERNRIWNGYVRPSDGEWVTGFMYFFLNYCPMKLTKIRKNSKIADRIEGLPEIWEGIYLRFHYIDQARKKGLHGAELASRGKGKAHPYNEYVYTPEGKKLWGDIQIGDTLFNDTGETVKVIDIPFDGESDIYELTLIDGRKVRCTDGHLFKVYTHTKKKMEVKSVSDMIGDYIRKRKVTSKCTTGREYNYRLPLSIKVNFNLYTPSFDAYTLGIILGDGCLRTTKYRNSIYITSPDADVEVYKKHIPYTIDKLKRKYLYAIRASTVEISDIWGLKSEDKYIPERFLYTSCEYRLNLLRGLLDTDGTVTFGTPILTTVSERLKDCVVFIVRSLGYKCSVSSKIPKFNGKKYKRCYNIRVYTDDKVFNLTRKQALVRKHTKDNKVSIIDIKYIGREKAKCVTVDSQDGLYLINDFVVTHNSFSLASILTHNFVLGENKEAYKDITSLVIASNLEFLTKDGTITKFVNMSDFLAQNTQFPRKRLKSSLQELTWRMGYVDAETMVAKGTKNEVIAVTSNDTISKIRGKRATFIGIEEFGSFINLLGLYNILIPSVSEGDITFGLLFMLGTAGDKSSDFAGAQEIMYNPIGYNMHYVHNVYDKEGNGKPVFVYFFPGYINRKGCYNNDGVSDVVKALIEILMHRYKVKYNVTDHDTLPRIIAEVPITPAEAIMKVGVNMFPAADASEALQQLDNDPHWDSDIYVGELIFNKSNQVEFRPTGDIPIREYPLKNNKAVGAIEILKMPERDKNGLVYPDRYISGNDPFDDDSSNTSSLGSIYVLDLWTDKYVARYTGRPSTAEGLYEIARRLCLFYNARLNYENNKKGTFAYFSKMNCLYLLTDTLEFLRDKDMIKENTVGNKSKGTLASAPINHYGLTLFKNYLTKPVTVIDKDGKESTIMNIYTIRDRALLKEIISFNSVGNFDRISSNIMLMLLREAKMITYSPYHNEDNKDYLGNDPFFSVKQ